MSEQSSGYLTPKQLVERWQNVVTLRTLANWRSVGEGPQYTKIGGKVLYPLSGILNWEVRRTIKRALNVLIVVVCCGGFIQYA